MTGFGLPRPNAIHYRAPPGVLIVQGHERRDFFFARATPRRPEIQHERMAPVRRQADVLAIEIRQ